MLKEGCSQKEIKVAYRKAALLCHPDKPGGRADIFNKVNECYTWLMEHGSVIPKPKPIPAIRFSMYTSGSCTTTSDGGYHFSWTMNI